MAKRLALDAAPDVRRGGGMNDILIIGSAVVMLGVIIKQAFAAQRKDHTHQLATLRLIRTEIELLQAIRNKVKAGETDDVVNGINDAIISHVSCQQKLEKGDT